jgi:hypothetical protein
VYDIGFTGSVELTERTVRAGETFRMGLDGRRHLLYHDFELRLEEGDVVSSPATAARATDAVEGSLGGTGCGDDGAA